MDIKVKTVLSHFTKGGKPCYQLMAKEPKTMTQDEFIERFAQETGLTLAKARLANDVHGRIICEATLQNYRVNTGDLTSQLVILGSLDSASAQATKKDNPVRVSLTPIGRFRDGAKVLVAVNDTLTVEAALYTVSYKDSDELNTIEGKDVVKINGKGLLLTADNDDEGVYLEDCETGVIVTDKATITKNDENVINCKFMDYPELTAEKQFNLVIATRNGQSKDEYGVVRLVRKVIVKPLAA